jgi:OOP family OmpA-OmpF porin
MVLEQAWAKIRERLNPSRRQTVYIEGYSDSVGSDAANKHISWRRAEAVAKWFLDRNLLTRDKVRTKGWGKASPVATNSTREGRAQNRRVEIILYSHQASMRQGRASGLRGRLRRRGVIHAL